jgi:hypothetical protein
VTAPVSWSNHQDKTEQNRTKERIYWVNKIANLRIEEEGTIFDRIIPG